MLGAGGVLVVWGTLDAWQLTEFERVARVEMTGTKCRDDLTWYAADRAAAGSAGAQAPSPRRAIDIVYRDHKILPTLTGWLGKASATQQFLLLSAGIGLVSMIAVLCGRGVAAWRARDRFDQRLWSHPIIREALARSFGPCTRIGCLTAALAAAGVWYAEFDRNADFPFESNNFQIQSHQLQETMAITAMLAFALAVRDWRVALSKAMTPGGHPHAAVCRHCGYPLDGLSSKKCPECGMDQAAKSYPANQWRRSHMVWVTLVLLAAMAAAGVRSSGRSMGALSGIKFAMPNATGLWRWFTLRSQFLPYEIRGRLPERQVACIGFGRDRVLVQWHITDQHTGDIQFSIARPGNEAGSQWVWTHILCQPNTGAGNIPNKTPTPTQTVMCDGIPVTFSIVLTGGYSMILLPFVMPQPPDEYEIMPMITR